MGDVGELDHLRMQNLGVIIEMVRTRHSVAEEKGPTGSGCAASLGLWTMILGSLEAAERYYEATLPASADGEESTS